MLKVRFKTASVVCGAVAAAALSFTALATHSWGGYHWARTTAQFTLQLGDNLSGSWPAYLAAASRDWNSPGVVGASSTPVITAVVNGSSSSRRCAMRAGTTQVCNSNYGNNGWLGLASINISGGTHITQGSAKMNDTYFSLAKYNNPNEKQHVMCQEIAHTFGLDHQSEDGSSQNTCMDYFSNTGANATSSLSTKPNKHDFDELNLIYAHLDSFNTAAAMASATATHDAVTDDPVTWGALMRQSASGRSSIYEANHPDGSKTVTHVTWTEEAAESCRSCDHRVYR